MADLIHLPVLFGNPERVGDPAVDAEWSRSPLSASSRAAG
jgi:hypothetical protein